MLILNRRIKGNEKRGVQKMMQVNKPKKNMQYAQRKLKNGKCKSPVIYLYQYWSYKIKICLQFCSYFPQTKLFLLFQAIIQSRLSQEETKFIMIKILLDIHPKFVHDGTSPIQAGQGYYVVEKEFCKLGWLYSNHYRKARKGVLQDGIKHIKASVVWSRSL